MRLNGSNKKPNKYFAQPCHHDGIRFASKREGNRYLELKLLQRAGEITGLELQPVYWLVINDKAVRMRSAKRPNGTRCKYTADFRYTDTRTGLVVVEDTKGRDTDASRLRRAVVECIYDIKIVLI